MKIRNSRRKIKRVGKQFAERLVDDLVSCAFNYCNEPFKECDTIIPGRGIIIGEIDVVKYKHRFWHYGCVYDFERER